MSVFQEKVNPYYCFMRGYTRGLCPPARCPFAPGTGLRGVLPLYEGPPSLVQFAMPCRPTVDSGAWHRLVGVALRAAVAGWADGGMRASMTEWRLASSA